VRKAIKLWRSFCAASRSVLSHRVEGLLVQAESICRRVFDYWRSRVASQKKFRCWCEAVLEEELSTLQQKNSQELLMKEMQMQDLRDRLLRELQLRTAAESTLARTLEECDREIARLAQARDVCGSQLSAFQDQLSEARLVYALPLASFGRGNTHHTCRIHPILAAV
jgi:chromosome segregation ATPase